MEDRLLDPFISHTLETNCVLTSILEITLSYIIYMSSFYIDEQPIQDPNAIAQCVVVTFQIINKSTFNNTYCFELDLFTT